MYTCGVYWSAICLCNRDHELVLQQVNHLDRQNVIVIDCHKFYAYCFVMVIQFFAS